MAEGAIRATEISRAGARRLPSLRTIHKVCALAAFAWLTVLGLTGWILDHHGWRWTHQWTVPSTWTSDAINRLVRGTIMRQIHPDPTQENVWLGASERGLWRTEDAGQTWTDVRWEEADGSAARGMPQTYAFVAEPAGTLDHVWVATDDGIWIASDNGRRARPFALRGVPVTSLTSGSSVDELVGVADESRLFRLPLTNANGTAAARAPVWIDLSQVSVSGLPEKVNLIRFALDLHVGQGFLPQPWSLLINDYGGIAMALLSVTGLLFWWLPRHWRGQKPKGQLKTRQKLLRWLYRGHAPVVGVLAIVPILYLSATGIAVDHITFLLAPERKVEVARTALPPLYDYRNLNHEVSAVVAYPDAPDRYLIASRFGPLETSDGGKTWAVDRTLAQSAGTDAGRTNLFRRGDRVFVGIGSVGQYVKRDGEDRWTEIRLDGPKLAISDARERDGRWYLKNSRTIYTGSLDLDPAAPPEKPATGMFVDSKIPFPPLTGTTVFLFLADIHTGNIIHTEWKWVNDLVAFMAIVLALSGPILWWRRKWA